MRYLLLVLLFFSTWRIHAEEIPSTSYEWTQFNYVLKNTSIQYSGMFEDKHHVREYIYTYQDTEEVNGRTYYVVYSMVLDDIRGNKLYMIHLRQDGKRVLVLYDEYKKLMEARGQDMSGFDKLCQYEVTQDGELVLYDFGMEVGDRFRSVDGKEDITVVEKRKVWQPSTHTNQTELDVLVLSNGCMLVENLGYLDMDVSVFDLSATGSFFDYLNQDKGYRMQLVLSYWNKKLIFDDWLDGGTSGIETTPANGFEQETGDYYDLMGRRLPSQPKQGVYIQNGKKFVIK